MWLAPGGSGVCQHRFQQSKPFTPLYLTSSPSPHPVKFSPANYITHEDPLVQFTLCSVIPNPSTPQISKLYSMHPSLTYNTDVRYVLMYYDILLGFPIICWFVAFCTVSLICYIRRKRTRILVYDRHTMARTARILPDERGKWEMWWDNLRHPIEYFLWHPPWDSIWGPLYEERRRVERETREMEMGLRTSVRPARVAWF
ncbi:hypothetical protein M011DRAFT_462440 [Sporormia fimetaria CBS 119925]|uniref:Transmembrane protein n=1 Tax=Sporormia fimetaria CBS 119925 TaxID=1340428 RepID=A0A6A6UXE4_9PLEO|nr:hypothetical protein M011DRAFT_462440 [Sporormia fimetaria CBS 119925]